jgi:predicted nucleic acid-binding protein
MKVVLDASVILKWLLADPESESDTETATEVLQTFARGDIEVVQPFHWLAEVGAVLARLSPDTAFEDVLMLRSMEVPTSDELEVLGRACILSINTGQHLFDTLYHAVALESEGTTLITADERYLRAAGAAGSALALRDWRLRP